MTEKRLTVRLSEHRQVVGIEVDGVDVSVPVDRSEWAEESPGGHGPSSEDPAAIVASWPVNGGG